MSNTNAPFGFKLVENQGPVRVFRYPKKSGNAIYQGDAVIMDAAGSVDVAVAGGKLLGIAAEYKAATDTSPIAVIDDPDAVFEIQASGSLAAADVFLNADIVATTGDTSLLRSKHALDVASKNTTATLQLKILGKAQELGNDYGNYVRMIVRINEHAFRAGVAGI